MKTLQEQLDSVEQQIVETRTRNKAFRELNARLTIQIANTKQLLRALNRP